MEEIRIGIIGYGFMGHQHMQMLRNFDGITVVAVCDTDIKQMEDAPGEVKTFIDYQDLLSVEEINTVLIVVPNPLHKEVAVAAARAGKHIICEKPAAMTVAEYDEMVEVAKECKVLFTVHHQRRWDKDYRIMKEIYDRRLVGDMYLIKSQLYGVNGNMHDWHVFKEMGGGMLYDWGVHLIDQLLNMVDSEIDTIYADVQTVINKEVDDYFKIIVKFKNKVTAEIELGTYYLSPARRWFIGGKKGSAFIDDFDGSGRIVRTRHLLENVAGEITMTASGPTRSFGPPEPGLLIEEPLPEVQVAHVDFFKNFYQAFRGKEELAIQASEVRRVLRFMEAVRTSASTNKAVSFE